MLFLLHKVGAARCPPGTVGCREGCSATGTYNGCLPKDAVVITDHLRECKT